MLFMTDNKTSQVNQPIASDVASVHLVIKMVNGLVNLYNAQ